MNTPDLVLLDAKILGKDPSQSNALAIGGGEILAVGREDELLGLAGPNTRRVRLGSKTIAPGFHDAHCHMFAVGFTLAQLDVSPSRAQDIPSLQRLIQLESQSGSGWIRGHGYDQNRMLEKRHPTAVDLDLVSGGRPVLLEHTSGHAACANTEALKQAGIIAATPDPPGGKIERGQSGEPTGVVFENAMEILYLALPKATKQDTVAAIARASGHLGAMGITAAVEASTDLCELDALASAVSNNELTIRCFPFVMIGELCGEGKFPAPEDVWQAQSPLVRVQTAKIFSDGALTTRTALLREAFADNPYNFGTAIYEPRELTSKILEASRASWQVAAHAIGDRAIDYCLDAFSAVGAPERRHRIEHAMLLHPDQLGRMADLGVIPVYQPEFIGAIGDAYIAGLGLARASGLMPYASTLATGKLPLVFSSDLPVVAGNPLSGIAAAAMRQTPNGVTLGANERISVQHGFDAYTSGAAYANFSESWLGRLEPGYAADLVVLSEDPLAVAPQELEQRVKVLLTCVAGTTVYGDWDHLT